MVHRIIPLAIASTLVALAAPATPVDQPAWETAAGGKLEFEVASVKPTKDWKVPNISLGIGNNFVVKGGRFSASFPLLIYIAFAYKFSLTTDQKHFVLAQMPKWVSTDPFEIKARAGRDATTDELRLMTRSLLAERFKLTLHFETHEIPVLALTQVKLGQLGPELRAHAEGPPCPKNNVPADQLILPKDGDTFPPHCEGESSWFRGDGSVRLGSRNTTMEVLAVDVQNYASMSGEIDKPVVDRTGLAGTFDYVIKWTGQLPGPPLPDRVTPPPDLLGTAFLQALRDQLGLKLVPARAPIPTMVIDHVERPSQN